MNLNKCPIIGGYVAGIKNLFKNGEKTHQFYQWFEDKAECFRPTKEELHADEKDWKKIEQIMKPRKQQCFYNSWQVALIDDSFKYYEGYSMGVIPTEHAWLVKNGKVFDPTYRAISGFEPKEYLGVEIPIDFVTKKHFKEKWCTSRINEYWEETA